MTTNELTKRIIIRLLKLKWLIILGGIVFACLLFFYAKSKPIVFTAKSSFFPLNSTSESSASSKLSELIGGSGGSTKSITPDANVNIEEVGRSKKTREAVVAEKIESYDNKSIAIILIEGNNKYRGLLGTKIDIPNNTEAQIAIGAELIKAAYTVKFNKNNLLEITFSNEDKNLLLPITNVLTSKISEFYKELKIKKARSDFEFLQQKVDSFNYLINTFDKQIVQMDNTTLFVTDGKLKYELPKEKLDREKALVISQRNNAVYNREEALLRLKKETPVIEVLDKPTPPYLIKQSSKIVYSIIGFVFGLLLFTFFAVVGLLIKYANANIKTTLAQKLGEQDVPTKNITQ